MMITDDWWSLMMIADDPPKTVQTWINVFVTNRVAVRDLDNIWPFLYTAFRCASFMLSQRYLQFIDSSPFCICLAVFLGSCSIPYKIWTPNIQKQRESMIISSVSRIHKGKKLRTSIYKDSIRTKPPYLLYGMIFKQGFPYWLVPKIWKSPNLKFQNHNWPFYKNSTGVRPQFRGDSNAA